MLEWGVPLVEWIDINSASIFTGAQVFAVFVTLVFLIIQIAKNTSAIEFDIHQRLNDHYTDLLWRAVEDPVLNGVWEPLSENQRAKLDELQNEKVWGAWFSLSDDEKKQYRFTRFALELFEQAFVAYRKGWIDKALWFKWEDTIRIWKGSRYYKYVVADSKGRFSRDFMRLLGI